MLLKIRPQVGDLIEANDTIFEYISYGYCVESGKEWFTVRYFDDDNRLYDYDYWYDEKYDIEMSIISRG